MKNMVASAILRMQNVAFVYMPTGNLQACQAVSKLLSFPGQTCTDTGLWLPMRAKYYETEGVMNAFGPIGDFLSHFESSVKRDIKILNFAVTDFKNANLCSDMASTMFPGMLNCQKKIPWRTAVYPDTGIANALGAGSLPDVTETCIYNMPSTFYFVWLMK
jgi:hypothetical protein